MLLISQNDSYPNVTLTGSTGAVADPMRSGIFLLSLLLANIMLRLQSSDGDLNATLYHDGLAHVFR